MSLIPDLRKEATDISFEHCSVLLERLRDVIELSEGDNQFGVIAEELDPTEMMGLYQDLFQIDEFNRMFSNDLGKGVLVGIYVHYLLSLYEGGIDEE